MTKKEIKDKFIAVVSKRWHVATWLYKVEVIRVSPQEGMIQAVSENGASIGALYDVASGDLFFGWRMSPDAEGPMWPTP